MFRANNDKSNKAVLNEKTHSHKERIIFLCYGTIEKLMLSMQNTMENKTDNKVCRFFHFDKGRVLCELLIKQRILSIELVMSKVSNTKFILHCFLSEVAFLPRVSHRFTLTS
jgi:hypothetical protein